MAPDSFLSPLPRFRPRSPAMDPYRQLDYLHLDDQFSEDELLVRSTIREWVSVRFLPLVMENWENDTFPVELIPELGELGVFGPTLPEKYGCAGMNSVVYGLICQELERGDSGLRSFVSVQGSLVMYPIHHYGSEAQKDHWLPLLASGRAVGCFGLTEPDFGSNPGGMLTTAKRDGKGWIINGRKMWITSGSLAHVAIIWAQTDEGIRGFVVPTDLDGFTTPKQKHKWSLRGVPTSELVLEGVRVGEDALLPQAKGLSAPLSCLSQARYGISWGALGAAQACFDEALRYSKERIVFDKPLAAFQLAQKKLADVATDITLGQLLALRVGRMKDAGIVDHAHISMVKRNNVFMALQTARTLRDMLGANGITLEYAIGRHMLNLESVVTYEGTHDIHTLAIGQRLTGIPAYR